MKKKEKQILPYDESCPVKASLKILGGKWTLMIIFHINVDIMRYGELKRAIQISHLSPLSYFDGDCLKIQKWFHQ